MPTKAAAICEVGELRCVVVHLLEVALKMSTTFVDWNVVVLSTPPAKNARPNVSDAAAANQKRAALRAPAVQP